MVRLLCPATRHPSSPSTPPDTSAERRTRGTFGFSAAGCINPYLPLGYRAGGYTAAPDGGAATQHGVPTDIACLEQPTSSHGRLPMALLQLLFGAAETPTHCVAPFTAVNHPLSALNGKLVHTEHQTRRWQCESRSELPHVSIQMVKSAWAGDVRWVCSRGGWSGTPPQPPPPGSQAACAPCRFSKP
jgi:hypothetical protein